MSRLRAALLAPVVFIGVLSAVRAATSLGLATPSCPVHSLTGLDCPGCGTTRALEALSRFDVPAALDHNALLLLALVFGATAWVRVTMRKGVPFANHAFSIRAVFFLAGLFMLLRNIPLPYLSYLAAAR